MARESDGADESEWPLKADQLHQRSSCANTVAATPIPPARDGSLSLACAWAVTRPPTTLHPTILPIRCRRAAAPRSDCRPRRFLIRTRSRRGRKDVYSTEQSHSPSLMEITDGQVSMKLFAASSAPDTDFMAKLIDVRPDGYAHNLAEGVVRARFRESLSAIHRRSRRARPTSTLSICGRPATSSSAAIECGWKSPRVISRATIAVPIRVTISASIATPSCGPRTRRFFPRDAGKCLAHRAIAGDPALQQTGMLLDLSHIRTNRVVGARRRSRGEVLRRDDGVSQAVSLRRFELLRLRGQFVCCWKNYERPGGEQEFPDLLPLRRYRARRSRTEIARRAVQQPAASDREDG